MVVVYLKNGEKAPMPDANDVKIESPSEGGPQVLRCFVDSAEVGYFRWEEVAGYTVSRLRAGRPVSSDAWAARMQA